MTIPQPPQREFELKFVHDGVEHTITFFDHPETGRLIPLEATQKAETQYVYNLIFVRPEAIAQTPAPAE